jgi:hypothetical protein
MSTIRKTSGKQCACTCPDRITETVRAFISPIYTYRSGGPAVITAWEGSSTAHGPGTSCEILRDASGEFEPARRRPSESVWCQTKEAALRWLDEVTR